MTPLRELRDTIAALRDLPAGDWADAIDAAVSEVDHVLLQEEGDTEIDSLGDSMLGAGWDKLLNTSFGAKLGEKFGRV